MSVHQGVQPDGKHVRPERLPAAAEAGDPPVSPAARARTAGSRSLSVRGPAHTACKAIEGDHGGPLRAPAWRVRGRVDLGYDAQGMTYFAHRWRNSGDSRNDPDIWLGGLHPISTTLGLAQSIAARTGPIIGEVVQAMAAAPRHRSTTLSKGVLKRSRMFDARLGSPRPDHAGLERAIHPARGQLSTSRQQVRSARLPVVEAATITESRSPSRWRIQ
jgi:hypothetical protein